MASPKECEGELVYCVYNRLKEYLVKQALHHENSKQGGDVLQDKPHMHRTTLPESRPSGKPCGDRSPAKTEHLKLEGCVQEGGCLGAAHPNRQHLRKGDGHFSSKMIKFCFLYSVCFLLLFLCENESNHFTL